MKGRPVLRSRMSSWNERTNERGVYPLNFTEITEIPSREAPGRALRIQFVAFEWGRGRLSSLKSTNRAH